MNRWGIKDNKITLNGVPVISSPWVLTDFDRRLLRITFDYLEDDEVTPIDLAVGFHTVDFDIDIKDILKDIITGKKRLMKFIGIDVRNLKTDVISEFVLSIQFPSPKVILRITQDGKVMVNEQIRQIGNIYSMIQPYAGLPLIKN